VNDIKNNNLEPFLKSEPLPEDNLGNVKVAVAKNFDDVVVNSGRDALIEFYAPWCGHCKKLAPIFDDLGDKLAAEDVDIVKMDATANDVPSTYDVRGFPTLYWSPKNDKSNPKRYEVRCPNDYTPAIVRTHVGTYVSHSNTFHSSVPLLNIFSR